jgi:6-phosphofructokinase 1
MIRDEKFGKMAALKATEIIDIPLDEAVSKLKTVDEKFFETATVFFN